MVSYAATVLIAAIALGCVALTVRIQRRSAPVTSIAPSVVASSVAPVGRAPENVVERFVLVLKRTKAMRFILSFASVALLFGAAWMVGYPFYTNLYQDRVQSRLAHQLASPEIREAYVQRDVEIGDSLTRIRIPRIGVDTVVVEGTTASALRAGAGHYPTTPLPCEIGNVGIAGHRTTYGRPFHDLDLLEPGDRIELETPIGTCVYEVQEHFIVAPTDVEVVANTPDAANLTLTTCHPKGSARQRYIIRAAMVSAASHGA